ncbi:MAG TPA: co-chaperone GroES [Candidatus Paceibacterota bacterium]|nr:co-chaperone GroES [Candidatus Paceibacterota bacterium]
MAPLGDRVLIKPLSPEEMEGATTSFGIIIPETVNKEKPEQGTVVAVGPGKMGEDGKLSTMTVKVGDKVMFSKYNFDEVKVKGVEYYIVSESNILAVIN